jgi:hypothetical protein
MGVFTTDLEIREPDYEGGHGNSLWVTCLYDHVYAFTKPKCVEVYEAGLFRLDTLAFAPVYGTSGAVTGWEWEGTGTIRLEPVFRAIFDSNGNGLTMLTTESLDRSVVMGIINYMNDTRKLHRVILAGEVDKAARWASALRAAWYRVNA